MMSPLSVGTDRCGSCGNDLRAKARFCDLCGSPVSSRSATGEHKQVTVLFADVVGSMELAATLDGERFQEIMNALFNRGAAVVQRYQGTVDKFTGDGLMALFGAPVALEDHALRACISALEIQSATSELATEVLRRDGVVLQIRVGLNSGEVIAGEIGSGPGRYTAVGQPVGMAQRMEAAAPPGGVLCSVSTARLVEDAARLGSVEGVDIKGADAPAPARQLFAVESDRMALGRNEGPMLGRDTELGRLLDEFEAARGGVVGLVGPPGLGKSRLIHEFAAAATSRGAQVVIARCEAHTTDVPLRALSQMLRGMFRIGRLSGAEARAHVTAQLADFLAPDSPDAAILLDLLGLLDGGTAQTEVSVNGRRRRLVDLMVKATRWSNARSVFILEDAHWIDATSEETLEEFATALPTTDSMFVVSYRPEHQGALQPHPDQTITLEPLLDATTTTLAGRLVGEHPSLMGLGERIATAAAGNPFFVEEIVRDLAGRRVLTGNLGDYRLIGDIDHIAVPATVQAVLAARIDRLAIQAKSILNAAAVIGSSFDFEMLHALLPQAQSEDLAQLVSAELIDQREFVPRQRYCFRHPLVRTVAYESQLSATRAQVHRRLAAALEARDAAAADENAALIATHLEAAGEYAESYAWHMRAAEWLRIHDLLAARTSWERARRLADRLPNDLDHVMQMRIAPRTLLTSTAYFVGGDADTEERYREFRELTTQSGDLLSLAIGTAGHVTSLNNNHTCPEDAAALASELVELIEKIDADAAIKVEILGSVLWAQYMASDFDGALQTIERQRVLAEEKVSIPVVQATSIRGAIRLSSGDYEKGRKDFRTATEQARDLHPVTFAQILSGWSFLAAIGIESPDELIDDTREALRRTEAFGDNFGLITAQWAHGTALLGGEKRAHGEAIELLKRARTGIKEHKAVTFALATIEADLALDRARKGGLDRAIDDLRAQFRTLTRRGSRLMMGYPAEALVQLLVDRASAEDLSEAHGLVDLWQARRPGIAAYDLWWLKSRTLLAKAEGDPDGYTDLAQQYLSLCEKLDARGRLSEARRMANKNIEQPQQV